MLLQAAMVISMLGAIVWVKFFDLLARHEVLNQVCHCKFGRKDTYDCRLLPGVQAGPIFGCTCVNNETYIWPIKQLFVVPSAHAATS